MALYMETTKIPAERTAQEISILLGQSGASAIQQEFTDRKITALSFMISVNDHPLPFRLPIRSEPILDYLQSKRKRRTGKTILDDKQQAQRIAWRQILRWVQAQLALIDTGMAKPAEVFLPYLQTDIGQTLYEKLEAGKFKAITANAGK